MPRHSSFQQKQPTSSHLNPKLRLMHQFSGVVVLEYFDQRVRAALIRGEAAQARCTRGIGADLQQIEVHGSLTKHIAYHDRTGII